MQKKTDENDLRAYRSGPFTLLQLMIMLAAVGLLSAWILQRFFLS
jgi:hypothetical protein